MEDTPRRESEGQPADPSWTHTSPAILQILLDVSRSTASHRDLPSLLRHLVEVLRQIGHYDRLAIVLHEPTRNVMRLHTLVSLNPAPLPVVELPLAETHAGVVWETQQPLVVANVDSDTRFPQVTQIWRNEGMKSACVLPLTSPLRQLGTLSFASRDENAFRDDGIEFLQQLTNQVALAVDNALHHEAAQQAQQALARERDRLQLLLEVNNTLASNLELRPLFTAVASCLRRIVPHHYTTLAIYHPEQDAFDIRALEFSGKGLIKESSWAKAPGSPAGIAFAAGKPMRYTRADLEKLSHEFVDQLFAEGIESACCLPLTVHGRRLGTLNVGRGGEPFTQDDEEILAAVANQVAVAVENALAFEEIAALKDQLAAEKLYLEEEIRTDHNFEEIIGEAPALKRVLHQAETVAPTDSTVLIRGETGTGKELIARAIHNLSQRRTRTFVRLNCAAVPAGLLESELFGHERGAFTGAIAQRIGRFELANGGTLFLDEVGDIPLELQPKLLRVLQEHEFERVGGSRTLGADVRVLAATNRNLEEMVAAGNFRSDFYYRLNVFPITVPPLRERQEDIPHLVRYYAQKFARRMNKHIETIATDTMAALCRHDWPGNVRELENAIERAVILNQGAVLHVAVAELRRHDHVPSGDGTLEATEREAILRTLRETRWVLGGPHGAAARLGLKRTTLQSRMRKLGIRRDRT